MIEGSRSIFVRLATGIAFFVSGLLSIWASGIFSASGAALGGVEEGGWNWQFLPAIYYGWLFGFLTTIGIAVFVLRGSMPLHLKFLWITFIPSTAAFLLSAAIHWVLLFNR